MIEYGENPTKLYNKMITSELQRSSYSISKLQLSCPKLKTKNINEISRQPQRKKSIDFF